MHDLATFMSVVAVRATRFHVHVFEKKQSQTRAVPPSRFGPRKYPPDDLGRVIGVL